MHGDQQIAKRRKIAHGDTQFLDGSKSSKRFAPVRGGRRWTTSVAVPGSMLNGLATADQRVATVARLARTLAIFCVDEVVIYNDAPIRPTTPDHATTTSSSSSPSSYTGDSDPCHFIAHILSFLECPPFMRRHLFPLHPNLRRTALLPPMDMPHHRGPKDRWLPYVEGVTMAAPATTTTTTTTTATTYVDIGPLDPEPVPVHVDGTHQIPPNTRVTLRYCTPPDAPLPHPRPVCVHPAAPRTDGGYYWGYAVRTSPSLSAVFTESPHPDGYDLSFGTSERGVALSRVLDAYSRRRLRRHPPQQQQQQQQQPRRTTAAVDASLMRDDDDTATTASPPFRHLLVVFGGPHGIETAVARDLGLARVGVDAKRSHHLFDHWVNVVPNQGVRGISTEEAVPIALAGLCGLWES